MAVQWGKAHKAPGMGHTFLSVLSRLKTPSSLSVHCQRGSVVKKKMGTRIGNQAGSFSVSAGVPSTPPPIL